MDAGALIGAGQIALGLTTVATMTLLARRASNTDGRRNEHSEAVVVERPARLRAWVGHRASVTDGEPIVLGVVVANDMDAPVFDVVLHATIKGRPLREDLPVLLQGTYFLAAVAESWRVRFDAPVPVEDLETAVRPIPRSGAFGVRTVTFTDAVGLRWRRTDGLHTRAVRSEARTRK